MTGRRKRTITRVIGLGALAGVASASACVMTNPSRTPPLAPPSDLAVHPVSFASTSGARIRGWFLPGAPGRGAVLLLHGVGSNRGSMVARARFLHRAGYAVLLPDFQAHGESEGEHITFGSLESLDAEAALDVLRRCTDGERVAVIGVSMGGAAALLGPRAFDADALVLESVYPTIRQAVEDRLAVWMGPLGKLNRLVAPLLIRGVGGRIGVREDALRPIDHIAALRAPVFVLSGTRDPYTPIDEARTLFDRASEPKQFWAVEGARHEDLYDFAGAAYERRVGDFLARTLRRSDSPAASADRAIVRTAAHEETARRGLPDRPVPVCDVSSPGTAERSATGSSM